MQNFITYSQSLINFVFNFVQFYWIFDFCTTTVCSALCLIIFKWLSLLFVFWFFKHCCEKEKVRVKVAANIADMGSYVERCWWCCVDVGREVSANFCLYCCCCLFLKNFDLLILPFLEFWCFCCWNWNWNVAGLAIFVFAMTSPRWLWIPLA